MLKIGVGAAAAGLGEAYTALASDATAIYWNPAGLAVNPRTSVALSHQAWLQDSQYNFLAGTVPVGRGAMGLSLSILGVEGLERRTAIPTATPLARFSAHSMILSAAYARVVGNGVTIGLTLKEIYEKIHLDSASGQGLDFGIFYQTPAGAVQLGSVLANWGGSLRFREEAFHLPLIWRTGIAYRSLTGLGRNWLVAADLRWIAGSGTRLHLGFGYGFHDLLWGRVGYQVGYEGRDLASGLGLVWGRYRLDYALVPFRAGLGVTHRISLAIHIDR